MRIRSLDHLVLTVRDLDATVAFYGRLGMRHVTFGDGRHALAFGSQKLNLHVAGLSSTEGGRPDARFGRSLLPRRRAGRSRGWSRSRGRCSGRERPGRCARSTCATRTATSSSCRRRCELRVLAQPLRRAPGRGEGRRLPVRRLRRRARRRRPDPPPRRRPVARGGGRGGGGRGRGRRLVDVVPDDAVGLLQPRLGGRANGRSRACERSAAGSRTTPSGRTSTSTTASSRSSPGTTPIPPT